MKIVATNRMTGRYFIQVRKVGTDELVREFGPFKNDITDIGLEQVGTAAATAYAYVGSGTTPATTGDTQMGNLLAATVSVTYGAQNRTGSSPYWVEQPATYRFAPPGVSLNVTEVGVGWGADSVSTLWSRALTVDGVGAPVTITVLADEYLDVTYTLRLYPELGDASYTVNISGVDYDFDARQAYIGAATVSLFSSMVNNLGVGVFAGPTVLGPVTSTVEDATDFIFTVFATAGAYVPTSKKLVYTASILPTDGNVTGGISGIEIVPSGSALLSTSTQLVIAPAIPKDATKSLTISFEQSWDRV